MCDDKTLRIKELERENADLSLLLHQTQSGIHNIIKEITK